MGAVRTPLASTSALALGNKRYRKQILTIGKIHHNGGVFEVTPDYVDEVILAFDSKAIARVPFQLADEKNSHTEDPLRRYGTVTALHRTPLGLDAVIELDDEAAKLVEKDPEFGVSVLIKHDRTTGDGHRYPAVLAHVLGTTDPVLALDPWKEELAASHDAGDVLDLLALTSAPRDDPKEGPTMADATTLTPEETATLRSLLPKLAALPTPSPDADTADVDEPVEREYTDKELQDLADSILADDPDAPVVEEPLAASHGDDQVLALSQRLAETEQARRDDALALSQLREERDESLYLSQRDDWARRYGVHPSVTDIVKPLLKGTGQKLALSNGGDVDPAALIAKFVHEIATRPRLDLSQATGSPVDLDEADVRDRENAEFQALAKAQLNH